MAPNTDNKRHDKLLMAPDTDNKRYDKLLMAPHTDNKRYDKLIMAPDTDNKRSTDSNQFTATSYIVRNQTSIAIGWDAPDFDIPVKFNIYYGITPSTNYNKSATAPSKIFKAHGLKSGTEYKFQLSASSADGKSQLGDPLFISTLINCQYKVTSYSF
ncbi:TTN [Mytilus coruscus]|uniref:TTN n=1 Tax=Mytilus coruscus TaxID=42192 RepID=A0A6J8C8H6_MYTCO|nr:TTN [Mytilus coruscus]